jgi:hypothetical protein
MQAESKIDNVEGVRGQKIGEVIRKWSEDWPSGLVCDYVEHMLDGRLVLSYNVHADPLDSTANPLANASDSEVSSTCPLASKLALERESPQNGHV